MELSISSTKTILSFFVDKHASSALFVLCLPVYLTRHLLQNTDLFPVGWISAPVGLVTVWFFIESCRTKGPNSHLILFLNVSSVIIIHLTQKLIFLRLDIFETKPSSVNLRVSVLVYRSTRDLVIDQLVNPSCYFPLSRRCRCFLHGGFLFTPFMLILD